MKIKMYAKLYALPFSIVVSGFGFYYFVFDSFNQYKQQHVITITQPEHTQNHKENLENERIHIREELDKIKRSANVDFIYNTLATNLNRINSYASIEFNDTKSSLQVKPKQETTLTTQPNSTFAVNKTNSIDYVPYRQIHTHELPNAFNTNFNAPTNIKLYNNTNHFDIKNTQIYQKNKMRWAIPVIKEAKVYSMADTHSKVLAVNKNGIKMQVVEAKSSWVKVRYAIKRESFIEGYMPTKNIRFVQ